MPSCWFMGPSSNRTKESSSTFHSHQTTEKMKRIERLRPFLLLLSKVFFFHHHYYDVWKSSESSVTTFNKWSFSTVNIIMVVQIFLHSDSFLAKLTGSLAPNDTLRAIHYCLRYPFCLFWERFNLNTYFTMSSVRNICVRKKLKYYFNQYYLQTWLTDKLYTTYIEIEVILFVSGGRMLSSFCQLPRRPMLSCHCRNEVILCSCQHILYEAIQQEALMLSPK